METIRLPRDTERQSVRARKRKPSVPRECKTNSPEGWWTLDSGKGKTVLTVPRKHTIFLQGEAAGAVFYVQSGRVKLTVVSRQGKEAIVAILEPGAFLGECCLAGQAVRQTTATAVEDSCLVRIDKDDMLRALRAEPVFVELFMSYLLAQTIRSHEVLVDQLFNFSEKRLARMLLSLAHLENEDNGETVIPKVSQEALAEMIGATRSRVSFFMNKFRKLGFIEYSRELHVRSSLYTVLLHD